MGCSVHPQILVITKSAHLKRMPRTDKNVRDSCSHRNSCPPNFRSERETYLASGVQRFSKTKRGDYYWANKIFQLIFTFHLNTIYIFSPFFLLYQWMSHWGFKNIKESKVFRIGLSSILSGDTRATPGRVLSKHNIPSQGSRAFRLFFWSAYSL